MCFDREFVHLLLIALSVYSGPTKMDMPVLFFLEELFTKTQQQFPTFVYKAIGIYEKKN